MIKKFSKRINTLVSHAKTVFCQIYNQPAYEISNIFSCQKTGKQVIEVKITGKGQSLQCNAEEIVVDNTFINCFSPTDIRTITYFATCDRYEKLLQDEKIKKSYEIIRTKNRSGNKTVLIRHKETNECKVISLCDFIDGNLIDSLISQDAYYLGYLAGQEQTLKDCAKLKVISNKNQDLS